MRHDEVRKQAQTAPQKHVTVKRCREPELEGDAPSVVSPKDRGIKHMCVCSEYSHRGRESGSLQERASGAPEERHLGHWPLLHTEEQETLVRMKQVVG